jgi:hypothetical protein
MKIKGFLMLLLVVCISCKKNNNDIASSYFPENASSISAINITNILSKMNKDSISIKIAKSDMDSTAKALMLDLLKNNGKNTGIDLSKNIYLCNTKSENESNFEMIFNISEVATLEKFIIDNHQKIKTVGNIKMVESNDNNVAWNNEVLIIGRNIKNIEKAFQSNKENRVAKDAKFAALISTKHDIYNYVPLDNMRNDPNMIAIATYMGMDLSSLKGNSIASYSDFDKGRCSIKSDFNFNSDFTKYYSYLFNNKVKTNFSEYINEKNTIGYMTLGLNFDGFQRLIETNALNASILKSVEEKAGIKIKELFKTLDGDLCFVYKNDSVNEKSSFKVILPKKDNQVIASMLDRLVAKKIINKTTANVYVNQLDLVACTLITETTTLSSILATNMSIFYLRRH